MQNHNSKFRLLRIAIVLVIATGGVFYYFGVIRAGNLNPSASPAGTFRTLGEIYNSFFGTSTDFAAVTASSAGSAIQEARCAINKLEGVVCP